MKVKSTQMALQTQYRAESVPDSVLARMFGASFVRHEVEEQFMEMAREMLERHARALPPAKPPAMPGN